MAESRPLYLLFRLVMTPLRLQRRYHADPLPTGTSIVVYICMPIANYTAASCLNDWGLPTYHSYCEPAATAESAPSGHSQIAVLVLWKVLLLQSAALETWFVCTSNSIFYLCVTMSISSLDLVVMNYICSFFNSTLAIGWLVFLFFVWHVFVVV